MHAHPCIENTSIQRATHEVTSNVPNSDTFDAVFKGDDVCPRHRKDVVFLMQSAPLPQPSYGSNNTVVVQLSACLQTEMQKIIQTQNTPGLDGTLDTFPKAHALYDGVVERLRALCGTVTYTEVERRGIATALHTYKQHYRKTDAEPVLTSLNKVPSNAASTREDHLQTLDAGGNDAAVFLGMPPQRHSPEANEAKRPRRQPSRPRRQPRRQPRRPRRRRPRRQRTRRRRPMRRPMRRPRRRRPMRWPRRKLLT